MHSAEGTENKQQAEGQPSGFSQAVTATAAQPLGAQLDDVMDIMDEGMLMTLHACVPACEIVVGHHAPLQQTCVFSKALHQGILAN